MKDPQRLYETGNDETRRQLNSAFYERFYIDDDPLKVAHSDLKPPFDEVVAAFATYERYKDRTPRRRPARQVEARLAPERTRAITRTPTQTEGRTPTRGPACPGSLERSHQWPYRVLIQTNGRLCWRGTGNPPRPLYLRPTMNEEAHFVNGKIA